MTATLLAVMTFFVVSIIGLGVTLLIGRDRREELVRNRLEAVQRAERRENNSGELKLLRDELLSDVPALNKLLMRSSSAPAFRSILNQAGIKAKPGKIVISTAILILSAYMISVWVLHIRLAALVIAIAAGSIPFLIIVLLRRRRFKAFERLFPEALDLLSRAVRAGHAFSTGMEMISGELPDPVGMEFRTTFEEQNFGLPFRDALINFTERVPLLDVRFFVTAILLQKETGGNMAEILDTLARVIRERFKIQREVRVRTAQGRLSAAILIALPPLMMATLSTLNPKYISVLFTDPYGPYLLITALALQVLGGMLIWKIVNFEV